MRTYAMLFFMTLIVILTACSNSSSSTELIAQNILENDPDGEWFMFNDRVYTKSEEFVHKDSIEIIKVGKIIDEYKGSQTFKNGMANILQQGTPIFSNDEDQTTDYLYIKDNEYYIKFIAEPDG